MLCYRGTHSTSCRSLHIKVNEILQAKHPDMRFVTVHPDVVETDTYTKSEMAGLSIDQSGFLPSNTYDYREAVANKESSQTPGRFHGLVD